MTLYDELVARGLIARPNGVSQVCEWHLAQSRS